MGLGLGVVCLSIWIRGEGPDKVDLDLGVMCLWI